MGVQTTTQTVEVMSVPADMLALRPVEQPVYITVPGTAKVSVTGHTNARYHQKATVQDVTGGRIYTFTGSGEDETPMSILESKEKGVVSLHALDNKPSLRTISVSCEFSSQGPNGRLEQSTVLAPQVQCEYTGPQYLKRMTWEIYSEDGVDRDYNDLVVRVIADIDEETG